MTHRDQRDTVHSMDSLTVPETTGFYPARVEAAVLVC